MDRPAQADRLDPFLQLALQLRLLEAEAAALLAAEAQQRQQLPAQLALQKALLTPTQVDIVDTLLRPDDAVPGYHLLGLLGQGGMGVVYRARQKNLNRVVALKTVLINQMGDPSAVQRFEHEAQAVARLAHPHIVAAYDFGQHEGRLFFVMELVEGEDVLRLIRRRGPLDEATTWGLVRQAAAGLAHAQQMGIVHRDIKPANLLLVEPPAGFPLPAGMPLVKIADFGLARFTADAEERTRLTSPQAAVGSPHYMSPEQLRSDPLDHRCDIYALGATAYHMLTGEPPLAGKTLSQLIALKLAGDIPPLEVVQPTVSEQSAALVARMLATDAGERPQDYRELIAAIDVLEGREPSWHPTPGDNLGVTQDLDASAVGLSSRHSATAARRPSAAEIAAAPTQELRSVDTVPVAPGATIARWLPRAALGGAVLLLLVALGLQAMKAPPPKRVLRAAGPRTALFDGRTLDGWTTTSGSFYPGANDDNAPVLVGKGGIIRRGLPSAIVDATRQQTVPYRLTVHIQLREATAAEVHFGLPGGPAAERPVLRLTFAGAVLGTRQGDRGEFRARSEVKSYLLDPQAAHDVQIERQPDSWWVLVEGEVVGALRANTERELPEFRLAAESGPAWFSDIDIERLAPTPTAMP